MRRLFVVFSGIVLLTALPALAGQDKPKEKEKEKSEKSEKAEMKSGSPKAQTAMGTVQAVSGDSVTVKGKSGEWTFTVDAKTIVTAPGASHKTAEMKADKKTPTITDFVKVGDSVSVRYHDMGTMKHASSVKVLASAKK